MQRLVPGDKQIIEYEMMVYQKSDGSFGFSWQQQYDFLLKEHPYNLDEIAHTKLELLKNQQPSLAKYYEDLDAKLSETISEAWDNNANFGYKESDEVVKQFIEENDLQELFSDVAVLNNKSDDDEHFDDELIDGLTEDF